MSLNSLLSGRSILKEYSGQNPTELSETILKLISQSVETSDLISDAALSNFSLDLDLDPIIKHVEDVMRYRPSLRGYTVDELLECCVLQSINKCVKVGLVCQAKLCFLEQMLLFSVR